MVFTRNARHKCQHNVKNRQESCKPCSYIKGVTPHILRHAFSVTAVQKGLSLPSFQFLFLNTLTDRISIGYNTGIARKTVEDESGGGRDTLSSFQYAVSVGIEIIDRLGAFLEFFGNIPISANGNPAHSFDTGLT